MSFDVRWTATALNRLMWVMDYISADNPNAAAGVIDEIFDEAAVLEDFPYSHERFSGTDDEELRQMYVGRYRLIYRIYPENHKVSVVAVQHTSQRPLGVDDIEEP